MGLIYRAVSTGVASDLARWEVWNGSAWVAAAVLPQVGDDVYANGFTVTIDVDSYASIYSTRASVIPLINAGGGFLALDNVTITGDRQAGTTHCIVKNTTGVTYFVGDGLGSLTTASQVGLRNASTGTCHIIGKSNGGMANVAYGTENVSSGTIYLSEAEGGSGGNQAGLRSAGGLCFVGKSVASGSGPGIWAVGGVVDVDECVNSESVAALRSQNGGVAIFNIRKLVCNKNVRAVDFTNPATYVTFKADAQIIVDKSDLSPLTLNSLEEQDQADQSDVRLGTTYANGALTGTCAVPPAAAVSLGVPVDNTVGTQPTAAVVASDLLTEMETSNLPIAVRMRNTATDAFVTAAVSAITPAP